jgi:hypothetical protein
MPQSPIGGVSFLINGFIMLTGSLNNSLRHKARLTSLITQNQITALEGTQLGRILSLSIAYSTPLVLFAVIGLMSVGTLTLLFNDTRKITGFQVMHGGYLGVLSLVSTVYAEQIPENSQASPASKAIPNIALASTTYLYSPAYQRINSVQSIDATIDTPFLDPKTSMLGLKGKAETLIQGVIDDVVIPDSVQMQANHNSYVYPSGRALPGLVSFLAANGESSSFSSRKSLAQSLGIKSYSGTKKENDSLRRSLGLLLVSQ